MWKENVKCLCGIYGKLKNILIIPKTILYYKYGITGCDQ